MLFMRALLGVETSCDDTSVAVVTEDGRVLANVVSSQFEEHAPYMGVVPELASRAHLQNMEPVFRRALDQASMGLADMAGIAVTRGPGLIGSLMVGINFAKALAYGVDLPLYGVNHIRGHVAALFLEFGEIPRPALCLIVSGGHTHLFHVDEARSLTLLTKSRDDAAGEAFDKLSKMLGLGFPGGARIDRLAADGDPGAFRFSKPRFGDGSHDYSFSGYKSAASRMIEAQPRRFVDPKGRAVKDLCASYQQALILHLMDRVEMAIVKERPKALLLGGGVACNTGLRKAFRDLGGQRSLPVYITSPRLSTDNAAMIAAEGWRLAELGNRAPLDMAPDIREKPYDRVRLL